MTMVIQPISTPLGVVPQVSGLGQSQLDEGIELTAAGGANVGKCVSMNEGE
jgi:hypothetical protein